jgi:TfoX/Sxy family transcriptional regulator of competence genes
MAGEDIRRRSGPGIGRDDGRVAYDPRMAYDEALAARIRKLVGDGAEVSEQRMFGGVAFLTGGNMAVAASGQGGLLVRVDPEASDELVATTGARPMEMRGRSMQGWLRVDAEDVASDEKLARWVERGVEYARSLPAKPKKPGR